MIKSVFYNFTFCFFLLFIVVSCQEEDDSFFRSNNYDMVYGFRLTKQIRGQLLAANKADGSFQPTLTFDSASSALLARSTANIFSVLLVPENQNGDSCKVEVVTIKAGKGSGNLTSSSRITTAFHVIGSLHGYPIARQNMGGNPCSVGVTFESSINYNSLKELLSRMGSGVLFDDPFNINLFNDEFVSDFHGEWKDGSFDPQISDYEPDYEGVDDDLRSHTLEENPLLANRLYSLSLESWSHVSNRRTRQRLRSSWLFSIGSNKHVKRLNSTQYEVIQDIGFLDACSLDNSIFEEKFPTGTFNLQQPGIFFDYVNINNLGSGDLQKALNQETPLFGFYSHYHPITPQNFSNTNIDNLVDMVTLIDGPRGMVGSDPSTENDNVSKVQKVPFIYKVDVEKTCESFSDAPEKYTYLPQYGLITNIDTLKGASGGNIVIKSGGLGEDFIFDGFFQSMGLILGHRIAEKEPNPTGQANLWGPGIPMEHDYDDYSPPINRDYATLVGLFDTYSKITSKIDSYHIDPLNLIPTLSKKIIGGRLIEETLPPCKQEIKKGVCREFNGILEKNILGDAPLDAPTLFVNPVYDEDGLPTDLSLSNEPGKSSGPLLPPIDPTGYTFTCDSWYFAGNKTETQGVGPGVAIGFVGSKSFLGEYPLLRDRLGGNSPVLGSLKMICTPWSSVPFVYNWQFLFWMGRSSSWDKMRSINNGPMDFLSRGLTSSFEVREILPESPPFPSSIIRPVSMKTCPPNYLMQGFNVIYNDNPRYIIGIESLICLSTHIIPKTVTVCLDPSNIELSSNGCQRSDLQWNNAEQFYTLNGRRFSLSQEIGQNKLDPSYTHSSPRLEPIRCQQKNEIIKSISIEGKNDEVITQINVGCIERPKSLE